MRCSDDSDIVCASKLAHVSHRHIVSIHKSQKKARGIGASQSTVRGLRRNCKLQVEAPNGAIGTDGGGLLVLPALCICGVEMHSVLRMSQVRNQILLQRVAWKHKRNKPVSRHEGKRAASGEELRLSLFGAHRRAELGLR